MSVRARPCAARRARGRRRPRHHTGSQGEFTGTVGHQLRLPLDGVRVVDLTAFWAGPAATHPLAAFGADVVKVESIQRPDGIRYSGGMRNDVDDWWEYGWVFQAMNTNKRSVTLDLDSEDGVACSCELVRRRRRGDRELLAAGDGPVRARRRRPARAQSPARRRPDAGVRARRPLARPGRLRAHHGADRRPGLGHRIARRPAGRAARSLRPAGRCPRRVRACWRRWTSPSAPASASSSSCR